MGVRPRILLVDDDTVSIQALSRALGAFAELRFVRSGNEALSFIADERPDLVMLDAHMPGMDGLQVLQALRSMPGAKSLPVILVTGSTDDSIEEAAFELGAQDFVRKPFDPNVLLDRAQALLRLSALRASQHGAKEGPVAAGARLLVVDDDSTAIDALETALAPMGVALRSAADGVSALKVMQDWVPDLVLLDAEMPRLDGFAVCQAMQADPVLARVPVAFISVHGSTGVETRSFEVGAADFLAKPFKPEVLRARAHNLLRLRRAQESVVDATASHWEAIGRHRIEDLVAVASDAIICIDSDGIVRLINPPACRLLRTEAERCLGKPADLALPGWDGIRFLLGGEEAADRRRREGRSGRVIRIPGDGENEHVVEPVVFHQGPPDARLTTLVLRDVTDRLALEIQREKDRETMFLAAFKRAANQLSPCQQRPSLAPEDVESFTRRLASPFDLGMAIEAGIDLASAEIGKAARMLSPALHHTRVMGDEEAFSGAFAALLKWLAGDTLPSGKTPCVEITGTVGDPIVLEVHVQPLGNTPPPCSALSLPETIKLELEAGGAILEQPIHTSPFGQRTLNLRLHRARLVP